MALGRGPANAVKPPNDDDPGIGVADLDPLR